MAANTMRIEKPIATPTSNPCTRIRKPPTDIVSAAGSAGLPATMLAAGTPPSDLSQYGFEQPPKEDEDNDR